MKERNDETFTKVSNIERGIADNGGSNYHSTVDKSEEPSNSDDISEYILAYFETLQN